jgi:hypothetical protein
MAFDKIVAGRFAGAARLPVGTAENTFLNEDLTPILTAEKPGF